MAKFTRKVTKTKTTPRKTVTKKYKTKMRMPMPSGASLSGLARLLNVEKKRMTITPVANNQGDVSSLPPRHSVYIGGYPLLLALGPPPFAVGQIDSDAAYGAGQCYSAWSAWDITPTLPQGITNKSRNGSSVKMVSSYQELSITQQTNTSGPMNLILYEIEVLGQPLSSNTALKTYVETIFKNSMFPAGTGVGLGGNGIIDANSQFDVDFRPIFRLLRTKKIYLTADMLTSQTMYKIYNIKSNYGKKGWHVRWNGNEDDKLASGQRIQVLLSASGNVGNTSFTGDNFETTSNTQALTGVKVNFNITHYYVDN